jgi:hypothetical protein
VTYWLRRRDGEPCLRWSDGGTRGTTSCVGCELPLGPAYGERGAVELAIDDEADDGKIEHGGIGLLMADNGQRGGGQEVKPPPSHPFYRWHRLKNGRSCSACTWARRGEGTVVGARARVLQTRRVVSGQRG